MTTDEGRRLCVVDHGDPAWLPVLVHRGTPNSRLLYPGWVERAADRGIRLIAYDRPGYGRSDRNPGRSVADGTADVRAVAQALGLDRIVVWGISGGGAYALACAALLPGLVAASAVLASLAPYPADGLDYFAGMGESNVEDIQLALSDPDAAYAKSKLERAELLAGSSAELLAQMRTLVSPADAAVLTGDLTEWMTASQQDGLGPGAQGWYDDEQAMLLDWGFDLSQIATPVLLLHGRQDRFVPFEHGRWLAARVPGVEPWLTEADGHLTLTENHLERVHEWLLARL